MWHRKFQRRVARNELTSCGQQPKISSRDLGATHSQHACLPRSSDPLMYAALPVGNWSRQGHWQLLLLIAAVALYLDRARSERSSSNSLALSALAFSLYSCTQAHGRDGERWIMISRERSHISISRGRSSSVSVWRGPGRAPMRSWWCAYEYPQSDEGMPRTGAVLQRARDEVDSR